MAELGVPGDSPRALQAPPRGSSDSLNRAGSSFTSERGVSPCGLSCPWARWGRGLARIQNCSGGGGCGGVRPGPGPGPGPIRGPRYLKNSQKVQRRNLRHWALENRLGAGKHAILRGILPRFFLVSAFLGKSTQNYRKPPKNTSRTVSYTHLTLPTIA